MKVFVVLIFKLLIVPPAEFASIFGIAILNLLFVDFDKLVISLHRLLDFVIGFEPVF